MTDSGSAPQVEAKATQRDAIEETLRKRILFIGGPEDAIPQVATNRGTQVYSGCPNDLIKELVAAAGVTPTPATETPQTMNWMQAFADEYLFGLWDEYCGNCPKCVGARDSIVARIEHHYKAAAPGSTSVPDATKPLSLADVLVGCAGLLDIIKGEWGESWSEWDQSIRDGITAHLKEISAKRSAQ